MDRRQELQYLRKWGFSKRADYERFIKNKIDDLEFIGQELFRIFAKNVAKWVREYLKTRKNRFVAEVVSPPGKVTKNPERVAEKVLDSWDQYSQWQKQPRAKRGPAPKRHHPRDFHRSMTDIVRFRIVCNYLIDIYYIDKKIDNFSKEFDHVELIERHNYIETPYPERRVGHRAFQYDFKYAVGRRRVLFEVQVMTQLQHAWDKKDHHLIYEYVRSNRGDEIPVHLRNRMAATSEVLYVADTVFDSLRQDITKIMREE